MYKYTILKSDGTKEEFTLSDSLPLEGLQRNVGGFIQPVMRPEDYGIKTTGKVYVNEDGKNLMLPENPLVKRSAYDFLVGNILIEEKV